MSTVLDSEQIRARYNAQAARYQTRYEGLKGDYYRQFEDRIFLEFLNVEHKRVLDLGTGRGRLALLLAERATSVVGIDLSDEMIKFANEASAGRTNVTFERADASQLRYASKHFDVVTSVGMFPYVQDVRPFFREINRVLTIDGAFVFSAGNANEWTGVARAYNRARDLERRIRGKPSAGQREKSPLIPHELGLLERELTAAGFELLDYRSTFFFLPTRVFYRAGRMGLPTLQRAASRVNEFLGQFSITKPHGQLLVLRARKVRDVLG